MPRKETDGEEAAPLLLELLCTRRIETIKIQNMLCGLLSPKCFLAKAMG